MARAKSTAVAVVQTPFQISADREPITVALGEVDIAPENLRFSDPPDDDIPSLAETLLAAGQLQPLTARPGRKGEAAYMALDGRRRLLALRLLLEQGRIEPRFPVRLFVETDPARQAAAVVLTNTAAPVHVADVIAAIGRMLNSRLAVATIAKAMGYAELDIKRLAALAALPAVALEALKAGRVNLRQVKLLARLSDADEQASLAQMALDGHGFQDWRVTEQLDGRQATERDPRFLLVGKAAYAAAGGRTEVDLFGERPPVLLDPPVLTELWNTRARAVALVFEAEQIEVHATAGLELDLPEDLERGRYVYGGVLSADEMTAYRAARNAFDAAATAAKEALSEDSDGDGVAAALEALVRARVAMDQISWGGRVATVLVFEPDADTGLAVRAYTPIEPEIETEAADETGAGDVGGTAETTRFRPPEVDTPAPETDGVNHSLHAVRTDMATRGLIRALADDPGAALTALIARLFDQVAIRLAGQRANSALALSASAFKPVGGRVIEALDGEVRQRLDERRAAWEGSGRTVIAWVHDLAHGDKMALLAELVALTLDVREERTSLIRRAARAEAAELSDLCGADISQYWTPDLDFLRVHSKPLLLKMLADMGDDDPRSAALRKTELVEWTAEQAALRTWAPSVLSWSAAPDDDDGKASAPDTAVETADPGIDADDGAGAFVVTDEGEAALDAVA